jgi:acetyl esterase
MTQVALDARAAQLLKLGAESGAPPLESQPLADVRAQINESLPALGLPLGQVAEVQDLIVPASGTVPAVPTRLYIPLGAPAGPLPVVAFFHGGGWASCGLDTHDTLCRYLANATEAAVLAVDYRLAPEHKFPAAFDDCVHVVEWLKRGSYPRLDARRIALAGDSAGGNLAAAVARQCTPDPAIRHQLLIYPVLDSSRERPSHGTYGKGYFLDSTTMRWFVDMYARSASDVHDPRFSPLLAKDLTGLPATTLLVAGFDINHDEALEYGQRLTSAQVRCSVHVYRQLPHGFASMAGFIDASSAAIAEGAQALRHALV